jgi:asparagine synthase (glutamine-hydrolysing)
MCGIVGIFRKDNSVNAGDFNVVSAMLQNIKHRGTEQSVKQFDNGLTVGFTRLAITELKSQQPFIGEWTIYLNGEIYNYKELGEGSECEVISKGLSREGLNFIKKLNGMFVILAINGNDAYLIRDRYGIKPVYHYYLDGNIYFASEIKAFLAVPSFEVKLSHLEEKQWMCFQNYFSTSTLFHNVRLLKSASIFNLKTFSISHYWSWKFTNQNKDTYQTAVLKVRNLVIGSIQKQTPKEVEFGTCLSGGIDSNIIAINLPHCKTFSVGYKGFEDERELASLNGKHHFQLNYDSVENFDKTIYHLEDLRVGASWANYGLFELASKYVKVLFDGSGADELFGGYPWRYDMNKDYVNEVLCRTGETMECHFNDTYLNRREFDANHFMHGVLLVADKLSMAHTIEVRVPFLDNDLVDYVLSLPIEYLENKKLLRDAFPQLQPEIANAPKKGFSSPDWIEGEGNQAKKWSVAALSKWKEIFKTINI